MFTNLGTQGIVFLIISLVLSVALHEAMHGFMAFRLGDTTAADMGRLTLNPLKHIDIYTTLALPLLLILAGQPPFFAAKPVPFNPARVKYDEYGAALVGIAGPLTNFLLALVGAVLYHAVPAGGSAQFFALIFTEVNIGLFVFNMIPFPPLDGSRLLYAFAPEPLQELMMRIESFGFLAILVFILLLFQFVSPVIVNIESHILTFLLG
jgi:Zn-dependent protease